MTANPFADIFYIDLNKPFTPSGFNKVFPKKHQFRNPKLREMQAAGFAIEKHGSWYEVWHNKLMQGTTDEYRTLREIDTDYYLRLVK
jgi:hypothetical protein|tara:strand:+ start:2911 stop:3171 length:261 start_codon:yes stop_codon:yes gene_type:complete